MGTNLDSLSGKALDAYGAQHGVNRYHGFSCVETDEEYKATIRNFIFGPSIEKKENLIAVDARTRFIVVVTNYHVNDSTKPTICMDKEVSGPIIAQPAPALAIYTSKERANEVCAWYKTYHPIGTYEVIEGDVSIVAR